MSDELIEKSMDKLVDKAFSFLEKIVSPPLEELGGLMSDQVKYFRFKQQVKIILKAKEYLDQKGLEPKKVPLKTLAPLLEHCSWEEDTILQDKWASLLSSASLDDKNNDRYANYVEILRQLSAIEVKMLDKGYDDIRHGINYEDSLDDPFDVIAYSAHFSDKLRDHFIYTLKMSEYLNISRSDTELLIDNLFRLNLLYPYALYRSDKEKIPSDKSKDKTYAKEPLTGNSSLWHRDRYYDHVSFTVMGYDFVGKCRIDS